QRNLQLGAVLGGTGYECAGRRLPPLSAWLCAVATRCRSLRPPACLGTLSDDGVAGSRQLGAGRSAPAAGTGGRLPRREPAQHRGLVAGEVPAPKRGNQRASRLGRTPSRYLSATRRGILADRPFRWRARTGPGAVRLVERASSTGCLRRACPHGPGDVAADPVAGGGEQFAGRSVARLAGLSSAAGAPVEECLNHARAIDTSHSREPAPAPAGGPAVAAASSRDLRGGVQ